VHATRAGATYESIRVKHKGRQCEEEGFRTRSMRWGRGDARNCRYGLVTTIAMARKKHESSTVGDGTMSSALTRGYTEHRLGALLGEGSLIENP
jgi:hypothetical protein